MRVTAAVFDIDIRYLYGKSIYAKRKFITNNYSIKSDKKFHPE